MNKKINRRDWLKSSALATAGLFLHGCGNNNQGFEKPAGQVETTENFIKLNQNENPFGISQNTKRAISGSIGKSNRYPGDYIRRLRDLIAENEGVTKEHVIIGAGCTEIFSIAGLLFGSDGKEVLSSDFSYFGFLNMIKRLRGNLNLVPLNSDFTIDLREMSRQITSKTKLVYVVNPNNPTGTIVNSTDLKFFCETVPTETPVFVDEAYYDLVEENGYSSMINLVGKEKNVIIGRTFSKIHGLAGLRIGYGIADPDIIREMRRIQTNFAPVSVLSLQAAISSYTDRGFIDFCRDKNSEAKTYLYSVLDRLGFSFIPSHTNFVLFKINRNAEEFVKEFLTYNILVRPIIQGNYNYCRVSMGTMEEMRSFTSALEKISNRNINV